MAEVTEKPSTVADIRATCKKPQLVEIEDINGTKFRFLIRKLPAMAWDELNVFIAQSDGQDPKKMGMMLEHAVSNPTLDLMKMVIKRAVIEPNIAEKPGPDALTIDEIVESDIIGLKLYEKIAALALSEFGKVEDTSAGPKTLVRSR